MVNKAKKEHETLAELSEPKQTKPPMLDPIGIQWASVTKAAAKQLGQKPHEVLATIASGTGHGSRVRLSFVCDRDEFFINWNGVNRSNWFRRHNGNDWYENADLDEVRISVEQCHAVSFDDVIDGPIAIWPSYAEFCKDVMN